MTPSLQIRLLYPLLWLWAGSAALAAISAFWLAGRSTDVAFDRILADDARALASQVHWDATGPTFDMDAGTAASLVYDSLAPSHFAVRTSTGRVLIGDARLQLPNWALGHTSTDPIFQNQSQAKVELRVVMLRSKDLPGKEPVWVLVAEDLTKRKHMRDELARAIFLPATLVGFVIVPLLVFGVRSGLKMASRTSESVAARSLNDLSPLPMADVPQELRPLVARINDLLSRLKATLAHERQFIAEAAHQLRTPVAGIHLLIKDLIRTEKKQPGSPSDPEVLTELDAAANRATHLVQQLLSLARADAGAGGQRQNVDVQALAEVIVGKWQRAAHNAGKTLTGPTHSEGTDAYVTADPLVLQDALENLIDNALLYGGPDCHVSVTRSGENVCVEVLDSGPALPPSVLERMREPFWRAGDAQRPGSGLGLSIADKAAAAFGGHLSIESSIDMGGTCIRLCLPLNVSECS